jgi:hypothetical protein
MIRSFWHKLMRGALEPLTPFTSTSLLHLKLGTALSRYARLLIAFFISALLHVPIDMEFGIPFLSSGAPRFFLMQAAGMMVEEFVQRLYRSLAPECFW